VYILIFFFILLSIAVFLSYGFYINLGKKLGQYVREDAPKHHQSKEGTPTAGGVIFSLALLIFSLILNFFYPIPLFEVFIVLFLGNFLIGFYDDFMKLINKRNLGLRARDKFFLHLILTSLVFSLLFIKNEYFSFMGLNFSSLVFNKEIIDLGWFYFVFLYFLVSGVSNSTNLTDGLDGLLASLSVVSLLSYSVVFLFLGQFSIFYLIVTFCIFLLIFLFFNFPRAKVFMGDSGSFSIGGFLVFLAIVSKTEVYLLFFGFSYFVIALSVILQVLYFKITKGRRLFNITPLHHHFELMGYSEKEILLRFNVVNLVFVLIGLFFISYKFIGGG